MTDINPTPSWAAVRQLEIGEFALGGANGNMNEQAKSLAARSEFLKQRAAYQYNTLAEANADIANIALNQNVNVVDSGLYYKATAGATSLTKSPYDPSTQAKAYTDTKIGSHIEDIQNSSYVGGFSDTLGNIALGVKPDGSVSIPKLELSADAKKVYKSLTIGTDDSIMHFGDSLSAGTYNLQHKAYICQLSQVSPFRHINYSDSGKMLINFHNFLLSDTVLFNATIKQHNPRYVIIATLVNDYEIGRAH